jgi:hypothetical protein
MTMPALAQPHAASRAAASTARACPAEAKVEIAMIFTFSVV